MKIYIIRHGESEFNAHEGYFPKRDCEIELTEYGKECSYKAGVELSKVVGNNLKNVRVLVSPYVRAKQTFEEINKSLCIDEENIFEEDMVAEHRYGIFHGSKDFADNQDRYPEEYAQYMEAESKSAEFFVPKFLGESEFDVVKRAKIVIEAMFREAKEDGIEAFIIVSHSTFLKCFIKAFYRKSLEWYINDPGPSNCSVQLINDKKYIGYVVGEPAK